MPCRNYMLIVLGALVLLAGCSERQWSAASPAVLANQKEESLPIETSVAESPEPVPHEPITLPADFPRDVPMYMPATITQCTEEGEGYFVEMFTTADPSQVMSYYHARLRQLNWSMGKIDMRALADGRVAAVKDDRLFLMMCQEAPGETKVLLTISRVNSWGG